MEGLSYLALISLTSLLPAALGSELGFRRMYIRLLVRLFDWATGLSTRRINQTQRNFIVQPSKPTSLLRLTYLNFEKDFSRLIFISRTKILIILKFQPKILKFNLKSQIESKKTISKKPKWKPITILNRQILNPENHLHHYVINRQMI